MWKGKKRRRITEAQKPNEKEWKKKKKKIATHQKLLKKTQWMEMRFESVICFSEEPLKKTHQKQRLGVMLLWLWVPWCGFNYKNAIENWVLEIKNT